MPSLRAESPALDWTRLIFVTAIGLSAFLLFTLELLAGRLVLPVFGGSPGVWTTALCLFTGTLFAGYLYAHVLVSRLDPRRAGIVHLAVATLVIIAVVLTPQDLTGFRDPSLPEAINVLVTLAIVAGPPIFLLSTTAPLLSAWYATRHRDPWWLYATSNAASFGALIVYPFILEPTVGLGTQRVIVWIGLAGLVAALALVVVRMRAAAAPAAGSTTTEASPAADRAQPGAASTGRRRQSRSARAAAGPAMEGRSPEAAPAPLGVRRQVAWLLAAAVPTGLLTATTSFIATDLISAPLLWIGPLGIYLASFIVAFSERGRRWLGMVEWLVPAAATALWIPFIAPFGWSIAPLLLVVLGAYGVLAVAIHGRLALSRPDERQLTRFYLVISAGGLLATAFVALAAPLVFDAVWEYPLLIIAGAAVLAVLPGPSADGLSGAISAMEARRRRVVIEAALRLLPYGAATAVLLALFATDASSRPGDAIGLLAVGWVIVAIARHPAVLAVSIAAVIGVSAVTSNADFLFRTRTFFGVVKVAQDFGGLAHTLFNGTTRHGTQFLDARRREPTTYYVSSGPLGDLFNDLRSRTAAGRIGVVGLGAGTVAAYDQPGDTMTFFEIDPAVVDVALDPTFFTYLADAPSAPRVVLGDARLSIRDQPDASFDLLVLDAFSSDAVPTHLLTVEAIREYARKLAPDGLMVFHVSNRFYDLAGAVLATAGAAGLDARSLSYRPGPAREEQLAAFSSTWVIVGQVDDMSRFEARGWGRGPLGPILTDDFSDILRMLRS